MFPQSTTIPRPSHGPAQRERAELRRDSTPTDAGGPSEAQWHAPPPEYTRALLFHARDEPLQVVADTPETAKHIRTRDTWEDAAPCAICVCEPREDAARFLAASGKARDFGVPGGRCASPDVGRSTKDDP